MADDQSSRHDSFISKVVPDPANPGETLMLSGFLGPSSEPNHTRIYQDATLENYVDVPDDAILHTEALPKEQSPLGGSYIWIKKDAEVLHGKVGADRTKAKFLEGPIQQAFGIALPAAGAEAAGGAAAAPITLPFCPSEAMPHCTPNCVSLPLCPSEALPNCTHLPGCGSPLPECPPPTPQCSLAGAVCPTHHPQPCPSLPNTQCPPSPPPLLCVTRHPVPCPSLPDTQCPPSPPPIFCVTRHPAPCPSLPDTQCPTQHPAPCPSQPDTQCPTVHPIPCPSLPDTQCPSHPGALCPSPHPPCPPSPPPLLCVSPQPQLCQFTQHPAQCPPSPPPLLCVSPLPLCAVHPTQQPAQCVASPNCPPVGPGTPIEQGGVANAAFALGPQPGAQPAPALQVSAVCHSVICPFPASQVFVCATPPQSLVTPCASLVCTFNVVCRQTFHFFCQHTPLCPVSPFCPGASAFCPGGSAFCPGSVACGPGGPGGGFQPF
jgi:hypothetical protein